MMQGRRHWRPLHGKARAMACGGNPRALTDFNLTTTTLTFVFPAAVD